MVEVFQEFGCLVHMLAHKVLARVEGCMDVLQKLARHLFSTAKSQHGTHASDDWSNSPHASRDALDSLIASLCSAIKFESAFNGVQKAFYTELVVLLMGLVQHFFVQLK